MNELGLFTALRPEPGPVDVAEARNRVVAGITGVPAHRRRTRFALAGGLAATAAAAAIVVPSVLPGGGGGAFTGTAWAVDRQSDGAVKITVEQQFHDPAGLERALRADGITAYVLTIPMVRAKPAGRWGVYPECFYDVPASASFSFEPANGGRVFRTWTWRIRPSSIPAGGALLLQSMVYQGVGLGVADPVILRDEKVPTTCEPLVQP
jgi:hypothetical protein